MPLLEHPDLRHSLARLTSGMLGFMDGGTASYSEDDIDRCRAILVSHAEALEHAKDRTAALELVKSTVTQLNTLNQDAGQDLIETDQREEICGFINIDGANHEEVLRELDLLRTIPRNAPVPLIPL